MVVAVPPCPSSMVWMFTGGTGGVSSCACVTATMELQATKKATKRAARVVIDIIRYYRSSATFFSQITHKRRMKGAVKVTAAGPEFTGPES
mmetsp:Transcript_5972/g.15401  ORF Transcript_5972/g.15401 Transcript_5972/m.15401 type:complete len:91 (+) Transcript_5972:212-484(+)